MGDQKRLSTKVQVSEYLKISITTLDRLTKSGKVKSITVGRQIRFDLQDLFTKKLIN